MPRGTPVEKCYQELKGAKGVPAAVRICQAATGLSLATGKPPKRKGSKTK